MREFKFFRGYVNDQSISIDWNNINRINDINRLTVTPGYGTITIPNHYLTHFIGDYPLTGTGTGTISGFSLTTSNPNGITYTTTGMGGTLTTNTATYSSSSLNYSK